MISGTAIRDNPQQVTADTGLRHLVVLSVQQQLYAIPMQHIQEVVALPELTRLPSGNELVEGIVNLSGEATPVVRLDSLIGFSPRENTLYTPLLILKGLTMPLALLVDRVHRIVTVANNEVVQLSTGSTVNDFAEGVVDVGSEKAIVIDPPRLLLEQELALLDKLRESEQKRIEQVEAEVEAL